MLHLATHGFFLADWDFTTSSGAAAEIEDPMLRAGLVFASANVRNSGLDDGVLTALEAAGLDLAARSSSCCRRAKPASATSGPAKVCSGCVARSWWQAPRHSS